MLAAALPAAARAQDTLPPADRQLARDILRELIEINTTDSAGHTPEAARAMAQRLVAAGFPAADVQVLIGPDARHGNLIALPWQREGRAPDPGAGAPRRRAGAPGRLVGGSVR